jgi:hypothetical protein
LHLLKEALVREAWGAHVGTLKCIR